MPPANNTIHILGGLPDFSKHSITDSFTNFMLKTFCANKAFISCDGVTPNYGITAYYPPRRRGRSTHDQTCLSPFWSVAAINLMPMH